MRYVALLRGINVGGKNMIKMETLRLTFENLGFENVKSYINSGNLAFDCRSPRVSKGELPDAKLSVMIHDAIKKDFGFDISVMVRSMDEINEILKNNPFDGQFDNDKNMHVLFLESELSNGQQDLIESINNEDERIEVRDRTLYCCLKISILDSAVGKGFIDKKLKIPATGRNWRTVTKIAEM
jgi:uncharacterized protein (DUF1697 family)